MYMPYMPYDLFLKVLEQKGVNHIMASSAGWSKGECCKVHKKVF